MEVVCREAVWRQAVQQIGQALAQRLEAVHQRVENPSAAGQDASEATIACEATVAAAMDEALAGLERLGLAPQQRTGATQMLWAIAGAWLRRGWLQTRAWTKPRGYAGDYELLAAIYQRQLCGDPLGRLLDGYFQAQAAPQAVRNRMALASQWIRQAAQAAFAPSVSAQGDRTESTVQGQLRPEASTASPTRRVKVALLGSATGLEVRQALAELPAGSRQRLELVLLDYDPAALEYAAAVLCGWLRPEQVHTVATNLARLPRRHAAWDHAPCDLMLIPGLLDYLDDAAAAALLAWGYEQLSKGGRLVAFQFAPHNPTRPYMEWIGDWWLIYRDQGALAALARHAGLDESICRIGAEPLGIDLFLSIERP